MKNFEAPRVWMYLEEPFTAENQMLTPKMSLRRKNVLEMYMPLINDMYAGNAGFKVAKN